MADDIDVENWEKKLDEPDRKVYAWVGSDKMRKKNYPYYVEFNKGEIHGDDIPQLERGENMPFGRFVSSLEGLCPKCGEDDLVWWSEDETERTVEAYMNCENCGTEFGKVFVSKEEDTSSEALKKKLKERHNVKQKEKLDKEV